jgi:hypothetical protein
MSGQNRRVPVLRKRGNDGSHRSSDQKKIYFTIKYWQIEEYTTYRSLLALRAFVPHILSFRDGKKFASEIGWPCPNLGKHTHLMNTNAKKKDQKCALIY